VAEFFGLVVSVIFLVVVFLPILTFIRLGRLSRELEDLSRRVAELETRPVVRPTNQRSPLEFSAMAGAVDATSPEQPLSAPGSPGTVPLWTAPPAMTASAATPPAATASASATATATSDAAATASLQEPEDLEERIGGRGLLYTGVFVLLLGVSFFLKYAFDNAWVNETARTMLGGLVATVLIVSGVRLTNRDLPTFGNALIGTGFAVFYLVVYAALNFYYLIERGTAFALMLLVTIAAALMADRQRAQALAFIAVGGGFLTPALVGGDENAQLTLFTYDAILVIGTMLLALRHHWHGLNALSYAATFVTVVVWAVRFYSDDQWLRTFLFLTLFCVAFLIILRETRRGAGVSARAVIALLSTAPVLYHGAAIVLTAAHPPAVHIYLIAFTAAGLWLTVEPHRPLLRFALLLAAFVPMFGALTLPDGRSWLLPNLITIMAVALLHVMAIVDRAIRQEESLRGWDLLTMHVSGLGLFALLYETTERWYPDLRGALALVVAIGAVVLARALRSRDGLAALHAIGLAFTLVAIGVAVQFDGPPVVIGWAAEGAVVAFLGVRSGNRAFLFGGVVLWTLATLQLFDSFSVTPAVFTPLLNARSFATVFVLVSGYAMTWRLAESTAPEANRMRAALHVMASALTLAWMTAEIQSYWDVRDQSAQAHLYEQMLLSLAWGLYGAVLIVVGMMRRYAPLRYIGIGIIAVTSIKVFFYDLWELGGIYRVIGFLGFGVLLVLVSYLYQSRRRAHRNHHDNHRPEL
jgi:uncharacterized membrane protein